MSPRIYVVYHVVVISLLVYSLRRLVGREQETIAFS